MAKLWVEALENGLCWSFPGSKERTVENSVQILRDVCLQSHGEIEGSVFGLRDCRSFKQDTAPFGNHL